MDQARLRATRRSPAAKPIELGNEPPLSVDGGHAGPPDRRRLSVQWFSGAILTGLCGAALMGGAVFASLDGQTNFATAPERVETALRGALSNLGNRLAGRVHKANRLPASNEPNVEREVLRVPTVSRLRNREMVRVRSYDRVSGNLMTTVSDPPVKIPPFNPQKLLAEAVSGDDLSAAPQPDAEVSFSTCDFVRPEPHDKVQPAVCELGTLLPKVRSSTLLPLDDVMARVRDVARAAGASLLATASGAAATKLDSAPENNPYLGFEARIVPENVTLLPKTTTQPNDGNEHVITARGGETTGSILHGLGVAPEQIKQILAVLGPPASNAPLKNGQKVRVLLAPPLANRVLPLRVIVEGDDSITAAAALSDMDTYVPVDIGNVDADIVEPEQDQQANDSGTGLSLYQSLWETALQNNVPRSVIDDIVRIYAYDVDFERKVQPGDSFDVLYGREANEDGSHDVRFVSLDVGGEVKSFYRFRTPDDGMSDYYDDTGRSARKFLVRRPVANGIETSPFGWRINPLLHLKEMHTGVDWAAPIGTPIFAAGDGTIEWIGPRGGYGKYVRIRHTDGYETAYGHMTAFARGLHVGSHVRQGQVIGFVGSTGMSTGPHVHFEIWVNGRVVDPMRIKLPRGRVLAGNPLAEFERDRHQLDALMANADNAYVAEAR